MKRNNSVKTYAFLALFSFVGIITIQKPAQAICLFGFGDCPISEGSDHGGYITPTPAQKEAQRQAKQKAENVRMAEEQRAWNEQIRKNEAAEKLAEEQRLFREAEIKAESQQYINDETRKAFEESQGYKDCQSGVVSASVCEIFYQMMDESNNLQL